MITLQQIAKAANCSLATVSYALRSDPRIHAETREHVQAIARKLGYRPNPRFSALMAHIRRSRPVAAGERIAFVWVHTARDESASDPFLQRVFHGARRRAESLGYHLEQFWTNDPRMNDRRLSQVIKARGIVGMLLSPVIHEADVALDFEWSRFSPAVIGNARWNPELHHAGHHHYLAMRLTLEKLAQSGCRRPMAIIEGEVNERARRAWQAAFLVYHPTPEAAAELLLMGLPASSREISRRIRATRPDAFVVSAEAQLDELAGRRISLSGGRTVTLHWTSNRTEIGGVDQSYDLIAANAVDLVVSQLNSNETGVPALPRMLLFPGRWVESVAGGELAVTRSVLKSAGGAVSRR